MSELNLTIGRPEDRRRSRDREGRRRASKPVWETPKLEDVSEQVMAQPYIRFT